MNLRQRGLATVEFAIVGSVALTVLIGCIEIGRMLFVWNSVGEATRRAARLATICPVNDPTIIRAAMLNFTGQDVSSSLYLHGLTPSNVSLSYLDAAGAATVTQANMAFVRVSITGYVHTLLIPFVTPTVTVPTFSTTLPAESLGYSPETNTFVACTG